MLNDIIYQIGLIQGALIEAEKAEISQFGSVLPAMTSLHNAMMVGAEKLATHFNTTATGIGVSPDSGGQK